MAVSFDNCPAFGRMVYQEEKRNILIDGQADGQTYYKVNW